MTASLLADCGGLVREIAICVPPRLLVPGEAAKRRVLGNLAESLPGDMTLVVLTEPKAAEAVQAWLETLHLRATPRLLTTTHGSCMRDYDFWIQDTFLVAVDETGPLLLPLPDTERAGAHAQWLAPLDYRLEAPFSMPLSGGNHLCAGDFRVLGAGSLEMARGRDGCLSFDAAAARHAALDGRHLHVFGFQLPRRGHPLVLAQQPHHVDLVLSVTGCRDGAGQPILLLADPRAGKSLDAAAALGWADQLDASAERLTADGFHVRRNPVPYVTHPQWSPNPGLRAYNNVIVENDIRQGRVRPLVWLPHYADLEPELDVFDEANRQIWYELGFEPIPIHGCSALARTGGAIRCASKVLRRGSFVAA
jgi:hypothetical protein